MSKINKINLNGMVVELGGAGGAGIYVGNTAPVNQDVLMWLQPSNIDSGVVLLNATIGTNWVNNTTYFTQEVSIQGIKATDSPVVDVILPADYSLAEEKREAWSLIYKITTDNNKITVYASEAIETSIDIQLLCSRTTNAIIHYRNDVESDWTSLTE